MYLAQLISAHPLYSAVRRLGEEIERHRQATPLTTGENISASWEAEGLSGPLPGDYPQQALREDWQAWESGLAAPETSEEGGLPEDLAASRDWRYQQIEADMANKLTRVRTEESRRQARLREQLVRGYLTELTNLGLGRPPAQDPEQPTRRRQEIWADIQGRLRQEQVQSEARVALAGEQFEADACAKKAQVDAEVQAEAQARREIQMPALLGPQQEMQERVEELVGQSQAGGRQVEVLGAELPPGVQEESRQAREQILAEYEEARQRQLDRFIKSREKLLHDIWDDTRKAVLRVAFEQNLTIHLVPPGSARGRNLTTQVRRRVEEIWSAQAILEPAAWRRVEPNENRSLSPRTTGRDSRRRTIR